MVQREDFSKFDEAHQARIAVRASMRCIPVVCRVANPSSYKPHHVLPKEFNSQAYLLGNLRAHISALAAIMMNTVDTRLAALAASKAVPASSIGIGFTTSSSAQAAASLSAKLSMTNDRFEECLEVISRTENSLGEFCDFGSFSFEYIPPSVVSVSYESDFYEGKIHHLAARTETPLWLDSKSSLAISNFWEEFVDFSLTEADQWFFWCDWYQGFLDGKPLDWELQRRVALIPDADWDKGPEHIAAKIEEIKAAFLSEKAPLAETVEFNEATAKFHTVPRKIAKPDLLGATLSQVGDALEDVLADQTNGLNDGSREVRALRRTLTRYANDPQRIEMDLVSVAIGLRRQLDETQELPHTEENLALRAAVEEGALGIRATHPEVAANREILAQQVLKELPAEDRVKLAEAEPVLVAISEGLMAEDFAADIPVLVNDAIGPPPDTAPRLPGADASTRIFSRVSKVQQLLQHSSDLIHKVHDGAGHKLVRLGVSATALAALIGWLVSLGLRIFGVF